jgi:hypothetical protein
MTVFETELPTGSWMMLRDSICAARSSFFSKLVFILSVTGLLCNASIALNAQAQNVVSASAPTGIIVFESPPMGEAIISKKPQIKCAIPTPYLQQTLLVVVDQTDMTDLVKFTESGFTLKPFHVMPAGSHTVVVRFLDENNQLHEGQTEFTTRHSKLFETATSKNMFSAVYSQVVSKRGDAGSMSISDWQLEGNLASESTVGRGPWQVAFQTNARYTEQEQGVTEPLKEGFYLADYLLRGEVDAGPAKLDAGLGDVAVEGTNNTIGSLSRRGITLGADAPGFFVNGFSLRSQQVFGETDSEDVEPQRKGHLLGVVSGVDLLGEQLNIRAIYASGGEDADAASFNTWPQPAGTQGDVFGLEIKTDFFDNKLVTRMEADWSDYDADTGDAQASTSDNAYLGQVSGTIDFFNYDLLYEYTGADYKVATSSLQQDRRGLTAQAGFNVEGQSLYLSFGRYDDNLERNPTKPRIDATQYGTNYAFNKISSLPMSIGWQRSLQDSSLEPAGTSKIENTTDTFSGSVSYIKGAFVVGLQPAYTRMDDETAADYDTRTSTLTLYAGYNNERFSIAPSLSLNRFEDLNRDTENDTLNCNLSFAVHLMGGLDLEGVATYSTLDSGDNTVDQHNFSGDLQLRYKWQEPIGHIYSPAIQLRVSHDHAGDEVAGTDSRETIIYLIFTGNFDLSF